MSHVGLSLVRYVAPCDERGRVLFCITYINAINTPVFKTILRAHLASDDWRSRTITIAMKQFCKAQCSQGVFTE